MESNSISRRMFVQHTSRIAAAAGLGGITTISVNVATSPAALREQEWRHLCEQCNQPDPSVKVWKRRSALEREILLNPPKDIEDISLMAKVCKRVEREDDYAAGWASREAMLNIGTFLNGIDALAFR